MAFGTKVNEVLLQPGTGGYNLTAGDDIIAGEALYLSSNSTVSPITASSQIFFGVAEYSQDYSKQISVLCAGNIVGCKISGGAVVAGDLVGPVQESMFSTAYSGTAFGVVVEAASATRGTGKVLLI